MRVAQLESAPRTDHGPGVLIETKLHPPVARKEWVERPELVRYLADAEAKLILVAAPPGFGKTTLVAQWRSSPVNRKPFAWISLDRADNDPSRLWWHVAAAMHRACPAFDSEKVLSVLRGQAPTSPERCSRCSSTRWPCSRSGSSWSWRTIT